MNHSNHDPDLIFSSIEVTQFIQTCISAVEGLTTNPLEKRKLLIMQFSLRVLYNTQASMFLISNNDNGTVSCILRSTFEFLCRGLWLSLCATDHQIDFFIKNDKLTKQRNVGEPGKSWEVKLGPMAKEIDERLGSMGFPVKLHEIFEQNKKVFNSLTHGGMAILTKTYNGKNVTNTFGKKDTLLQSYYQLLMSAYATTSLLATFEKHKLAEDIVKHYIPINDSLYGMVQE
ncbi:hypothetical protein Q4574_00890 [Aliiglaciecola sp. 3_MG-2023]|uniref:DUF6988 family protein n=1 Tax=Aliiglaciecola sp. 3_MG-2023 TaxID=3062644 RepID=UPI0026E2ED50|nr:hypothetical protein [Aliiglaciecola sp. 3_MG-2023]MDO6691812.1 hypothetical protein [Aliiglaciecola sp. 3_MG-2023]